MKTAKILRYEAAGPLEAAAFAEAWRAYGYRDVRVVGCVVFWTEDTTD